VSFSIHSYFLAAAARRRRPRRWRRGDFSLSWTLTDSSSSSEEEVVASKQPVTKGAAKKEESSSSDDDEEEEPKQYVLSNPVLFHREKRKADGAGSQAKKAKGGDEVTVFVANLPWSATEADIRASMEGCGVGEIGAIDVKYGDDGRAKGLVVKNLSNRVDLLLPPFLRRLQTLS
jgi:hypothetical protein